MAIVEGGATVAGTTDAVVADMTHSARIVAVVKEDGLTLVLLETNIVIIVN
jgi:hypothetical protein